MNGLEVASKKESSKSLPNSLKPSPSALTPIMKT